MRKLLLHIFLCCAISSNAQDEHYLLIGTYTGGKSEGIYVYKFNSATAENTLVSVTKSSNPSFLTVSPNEKKCMQ
jgi:6-phosphogluconolactonase